MTDPEDGPEVGPVVQVDHPDWCTNYRPDHGTHTGDMGDVSAQGGDVVLGLWQTVGGRPFVEMTAGRGTVDRPSVSLFLSPRQAGWLGRRLIEAERILREAAEQ